MFINGNIIRCIPKLPLGRFVRSPFLIVAKSVDGALLVGAQEKTRRTLSWLAFVVYHAPLSRRQEAGEPWLRRPSIVNGRSPPPHSARGNEIHFDVRLQGIGALSFDAA